MTCRVWERWNTLQCGVKTKAGKVLLKPNVGCKRYGVLPTKTRGYHDLFCGMDGAFRWDGRRYVI